MPLTNILNLTLSPNAQILSDPSSPTFQSVLQRWSNIDVQTPGAILRPATEDDVVTIVKTATTSRVPFVLSSGGHSLWSTIDSHGFILDMGLCNSITINPDSDSVTVTGAVLMKELKVALAPAGRCTATGNGNTVGVIPFCLNGGISPLTALIGFGATQILSAHLVTATGELLHLTPNTHGSLLWALKGAGQYFGVVTSLTLKTYPLSIFGSEDGTHWMGNYVFGLDKAEEVCGVLEEIMVSKEYDTSGSVMVVAAPGLGPVLIVGPHFFGNPTHASQAFTSLASLSPLHFSTSTPPYINISDHLDFACAKGDYKRFNLAGSPDFCASNFLAVISTWKDLMAACPDAAATGYLFEWHTAREGTEASKLGWEKEDTAFGQGPLCWLNCFSWYHEASNHEIVREHEEKAIAAMRNGYPKEEWTDYANCNRADPIERRYRGETLERLRGLKQEWDPTGVFTRQLL